MIWWDWHHVAIFKLDVSSDRVLVHCFESRWGSRRAKLVSLTSQYSRSWRDRTKETFAYQTRVYPWLKGVRDEEIPSFKEVNSKKKEFIDKLKGRAFPRVINVK